MENSTFKYDNALNSKNINLIVMEYEKHYHAPEGFGDDTNSYEEDLLYNQLNWEE